ncbi:MAG: PAS domain S-box protein [Candidatus Fermentithermobacillus carboniphilus]|uniref:histidine kinase n=1 Tax=Candidatus Fermentithermobacillus carboniphilus TaxID=3085328 RepID=A0AAT9LEF6_9FIRM|nr:MAG: PAS domain S-box protein [Candidatus Fermentithermobacillus carboniphilus]
MNRKSLRVSLLKSFVAVSCIAMLLVGSFFFVFTGKQYMKNIQNHMEHQAKILRDLFAPYMLPTPRPDLLEREVTRLKRETGMRITVVALDGTVLADSDENPSIMENHGKRPEILMALSQGKGIAVRWSYTVKKHMLYVAVPIEETQGTLGIVRVSLPVSLLESEIRQNWPVLAGAIFFALGVALAFAFVMSKKMATPIEAMSAMAMDMASGSYREHAFPTTNTELDDLGHSLNFLASNLAATISEMKRTNQKLSAVLDASAWGMVIVESDGVISSTNRAAEEILGASRQKLEGISFWAALRNSDLASLVERALYQKQKGRVESTVLYPRERIVDAVAVPLGNGSGSEPGAVLILNDITELRHLETVRRDFIQNISHELRTPITVVKGFAETLKETMPDDPETVREMAGLINDEAGRLADLVEKLLNLAKIESGYLTPQKTSFPVKETLEEIIRKMELLARRKDQTIVLTQGTSEKIPEGGPGTEEKRGSMGETDRSGENTVWADKLMFDMIVTNLLDNAIKYSGEGSRIEIGYSCDENGTLFWVKDDGPGIPAEDLSRIFERFYRAAKDRSRDTGGSGLGLAIVKHCTAAHGGKVWVESGEGRGARFFVWLPSSTPEKPHSPQQETHHRT